MIDWQFNHSNHNQMNYVAHNTQTNVSYTGFNKVSIKSNIIKSSRTVELVILFEGRKSKYECQNKSVQVRRSVQQIQMDKYGTQFKKQ